MFRGGGRFLGAIPVADLTSGGTRIIVTIRMEDSMQSFSEAAISLFGLIPTRRLHVGMAMWSETTRGFARAATSKSIAQELL